MRAPLQQWHVKVRLHGVHDDYTLRLRLPDLDDVEDVPDSPRGRHGPSASASRRGAPAGERGDEHAPAAGAV